MKRYVDIDAEIERMLRQTGAPRLANGVAIDILAILRTRLDFDVAYIKNLALRGEPVSGALIPDRKLVLIEANDIPERQRFTLAHECAHLFLDFRNSGSPSLFGDAVDTFVCAPSDVDAAAGDPSWLKLREVPANRFAAHLLMPDSLCRELFIKTRSLEACALGLGVSKQAISIRLKELDVA